MDLPQELEKSLKLRCQLNKNLRVRRLLRTAALIAVLLLLLASKVVVTELRGGRLERQTSLDYIFQAKLFLMAIIAGFLGALMGIGGGIIIVPTLTSVFNLPIREAIAVSIVSVIATSISGKSTYFKQGMTNVRLAIFLETSTAIGALIGAMLVLIVPGSLLYLIFSSFTFYVGISQLYSLKAEVRRISSDEFRRAKPDVVSAYLSLSGEYFDEAERTKVEYVVKNSIAGWLVSLLAGIGSGMLGIGGGFLKVSAMNVFMNVPLKVAIATSKFMIGVTAATSAIIYYVCGLINFSAVAPTALGTTTGAILGTGVMNKIRVKWLKIAFSLLTFYLGYSMLRKGVLSLFGVALP